jgi:hypothetical protein
MLLDAKGQLIPQHVFYRRVTFRENPWQWLRGMEVPWRTTYAVDCERCPDRFGCSRLGP